MRKSLPILATASLLASQVIVSGCAVKFEDWALLEDDVGGVDGGESGAQEDGAGAGGDIGGTGGSSSGGAGFGGATAGGEGGVQDAGGANGGDASGASGGMTTGGAPDGGSATGGAVSGGVAAGGATTGGAATGGVASGGANSGGVATGGAETGGVATGGVVTGGVVTGGVETGGVESGGVETGGVETGGVEAGGVATGGVGEVDCNAAMPTSGAQEHSSTWAEGGSGNLAWQIRTNGDPGSLTTYDVPAFRASWNNSGAYVGRMGFEWGNAGESYAAYGTIKANYVFKKSGTAGQYSYLGIYGWSNNPCVEWYIVEDSFHQMPLSTGTSPSGTAEIDGGTYHLVHRTTSGTGGDRCGGAGSWDQYYSIRTQGKQCGTITVSDHFAAWEAKGWHLGNLLEVKIVVEAADGEGSVDFPVANLTTSQ